MKKFTKFCVIFGVVCVVLGIGLSAGAVAMGAQLYDLPSVINDNYVWVDGHRVYSPNYDSVSDRVKLEIAESVNTAEVYTGVRNLDIEVAAGTVSVVTGNQEDIEVRDYSTEFRYGVYMEGDTLKIEAPREYRMFSRDNNRELIVTIPEDYEFHEIDVEVKAGEFIAEKLVADSLDVDTDAGSARIEDGSVRKFSADCKAGEITYAGAATDEIEADCSAGSIELELVGEETDYNYEAKVSAGSIQIGDQLYEGLGNRGSGKHKGAAGMMELKCKAGGIVVSFQ